MGRTPTITDEEFIKAYMDSYREGRTYSQLAEELGLVINSLYIRCSRLRYRGVDLPRLAKSPSRARNTAKKTSELNQLVDELRPEVS